MIDGHTIVALLFLVCVLCYVYLRSRRSEAKEPICTGSHCTLPDCDEHGPPRPETSKLPPIKPERIHESEDQLEARMERLLARHQFSTGDFFVEPYLQLGSQDPCLSFEILWALPVAETRTCQLLIDQSQPAIRVDLTTRVINLEGVPPHVLYFAQVRGFNPGSKLQYAIELGGTKVFYATAQTPIARESQKQRFAVVGDMGEGSEGQKQIADLIWQAQPALLAITGDVVYSRGRVKEYLARLFPVFNGVPASPLTGAPIMRSVIAFSSGGNHCFGRRRSNTQDSLDDYADLYAYFIYLSMPLNGPKKPGATTSVPVLQGKDWRVQAFLDAAGPRYPSQANFSFNWGTAFWLVLDANGYMNWSEPELRQWVERELAASKADPNCLWRFVNFHQPAFTSHPKHKLEVEIRKLFDLFQKYGVNVIFSGHSHWYERSYPLGHNSSRKDKDGNLGLDLSFDGVNRRIPKGIINIVSGAGGAQLNDGKVSRDPTTWESFTCKIVADRHSYTLCDIDGKTLTIAQIDEDGTVIDKVMVEQR